MFGEFHAPFQRHCCFLSCPLHAPSPSHLLHSVSVLGTHCAHSVNICCMDELVCAPSLCAFPQPGMSLSCPSSSDWLFLVKPLLGLWSWWRFPLCGRGWGSVTLFTAAFILPDLQLSHHSVTIHSHTCFHHQLVSSSRAKMGLDTIGFSVPSAMPGLCQQLNLTPTIKHNCGRDPNILLCS